MDTTKASKPHICFEVEKVIGVSSDGNYQVQWAPAWVSKFHLVDCEHLIQEFLQEQQQQQQQQQQQLDQQQQQDQHLLRQPLKQQQHRRQKQQNKPYQQQQQQQKQYEQLQQKEQEQEEEQENTAEMQIALQPFNIEHHPIFIHGHSQEYGTPNSNRINAGGETSLEQPFNSGGQQVDPSYCSEGTRDTVKDNSNEPEIEIGSMETVIKVETDEESSETNCTVDSHPFYEPLSEASDNIAFSTTALHSEGMWGENFDQEGSDNQLTNSLSNTSQQHTYFDMQVDRESFYHYAPTEINGVFICSYCDQEFASGESLGAHIQQDHSGDKPYPCPTCEKSFTKKGNLNAHLRIHTGEKPHLCEKCGKRFNHRGTQRRHSRTCSLTIYNVKSM